MFLVERDECVFRASEVAASLGMKKGECKEGGWFDLPVGVGVSPPPEPPVGDGADGQEFWGSVLSLKVLLVTEEEEGERECIEVEK